MIAVLTNDTLQESAPLGLPPLAGKRVLSLGLARQGLALARFCARAGARVTVSDLAPADKLESELAALAPLIAAGQVATALGGHPLALLDACDLLCLSGGVPAGRPNRPARRRRSHQSTRGKRLSRPPPRVA